MDRQANMNIEISDASLSDYLRTQYQSRQDTICGSLQMSHMIHELAVELHNHKLNTIGELDKALARTEEAVKRFEEDNPQSKLSGNRYFPIAIVKISMELLYDDFPMLTKRVVDPDKLAEYRKYILPEGN